MFAIRTLAVLAVAVAAGTVFAQSPAPADAGPATAAAVAALCPKPDPHPGRLASDQKRRGWTKEVNTWQECAKKYIAELQTKADSLVKAANAANAEAGAAISAYNSAVKEFQAQAEAAAN